MAILQVYRFLWITGIVFVPHITAGLLSDYKICGDSECESLMSRVQAIRDHHGEDCRFLSFRRGDYIFVYHKLTGRRDDLWAGTIDKQFGYFPKDAVQEEQVYATAEKVVETQRSDFFCMDELGHPVDFSDLDSGHKSGDQIIQSQETQYIPTMLSTEETNVESPPSVQVSAQQTDGAAIEGDETKNAGDAAAGSHMETQNNPVAQNEQGGSPSSSWLTSPMTGWLGLERQEESVSLPEEETDDDRQETKAETLTSSVSGWLGFGGEEKANGAVKNGADGSDSFTSSMTEWLGLRGETEINPSKTEQDAKSEIKEENIVIFNSRRISLDLEGSQLHEEEKKDMPTLDWLGNTLSHTLGFGVTNQESQPETRAKTEAEETIREEREQSASSSWLGIGNILGYRKDESEADDSTGSDFKDKALEQEVIDNENLDEEKVEIEAQKQELEIESSQETPNNSISSSSKQYNNKENVTEQYHVPQPQTKAESATLALAEDISNNNIKALDGSKNNAASILDQKDISPQDRLEEESVAGDGLSSSVDKDRITRTEYDEHQVPKPIENDSSRESEEDVTASNTDLNILTQSDINPATGLVSMNLNSDATTGKVEEVVKDQLQRKITNNENEEGGEITPLEIGGDGHDSDGSTKESVHYSDITAVTDVNSTETHYGEEEGEREVESIESGSHDFMLLRSNMINKESQSEKASEEEKGNISSGKSIIQMKNSEDRESVSLQTEQRVTKDEDGVDKLNDSEENAENNHVVLAESGLMAAMMSETEMEAEENETMEKKQNGEEWDELKEVEKVHEEEKKQEIREEKLVETLDVAEEEKEKQQGVNERQERGKQEDVVVEFQEEKKQELLNEVEEMMVTREMKGQKEVNEMKEEDKTKTGAVEVTTGEEKQRETEESREVELEGETNQATLQVDMEIQEDEKQGVVGEFKLKDDEKTEELEEVNKVERMNEKQDEMEIKEQEKHEEVEGVKEELQNREETRQEEVEVKERKEEEKQQEADILMAKEKPHGMEGISEGGKQERVEELKEVEELIDKETMQEVKETPEEGQQEDLMKEREEEKREHIEGVNKEDEIEREEMQKDMKKKDRQEEIKELKKEEERQEEVVKVHAENRQEGEEKEMGLEKGEQVNEVKEETFEDGVELEVEESEKEKQERGEASAENQKQKEVMEMQEMGKKEEAVAFNQETKEAEKQEVSGEIKERQTQVEEEEKQEETDEAKGDGEVVEEAKEENTPEVEGLKEEVERKEMEEFNEKEGVLNNEIVQGEVADLDKLRELKDEEKRREMEEVKEKERQVDVEELEEKGKSDMEEIKEEKRHKEIEDLKTVEKRVEEVKEEEKQVAELTKEEENKVEEELKKEEGGDEEVKEEEEPEEVEGSKEEEKQTEIKEFQEDKQDKVVELNEKHKQEIQVGGKQEEVALKEERRQEGLKEVKKNEKIIKNETTGEVEELKEGEEEKQELTDEKKRKVNEFNWERGEEVEKDDKKDKEEGQSIGYEKTSEGVSSSTDEDKIQNHHTSQLQTREGSIDIVQTEYVDLSHLGETGQHHEILHNQAAENKEYAQLLPSEAKQSDLSDDKVLYTEHDDSETGRDEKKPGQIHPNPKPDVDVRSYDNLESQVNDQAVISEKTVPHVSKDPTGSPLLSDDGNTRTAETGDGGAFGLFKNVFGFYSQTPAAKTSDSLDSGLSVDETAQLQASLISEQEIYSEQDSPVTMSTGEPQYSSSSADIQISTLSHPNTPSPHIESAQQTKPLPKSYKYLLAYMSVDEASTLIEVFGPYKLQFLDFMLGSSGTVTEDESILSDIERHLHYHRETLSTPTTRLPREDKEKTSTLVALQKLEMLMTRVRETFSARKSDTRRNSQAEVSYVSGSCSAHSKDREMSTEEHSIKTGDSSVAQENNIRRDERRVEENGGKRVRKSAHDKREDLEGGCEEESVFFAGHPYNQSGSPQTLEGALTVILDTVHHIAKESITRAHAVRELLIWTAQVVSSLPDDIRPGPDLYGVPWEPVIVSCLVGLMTVLLFTCRCYSSVKSRMYRSKERWMAAQVAQLLDEKCKVLESLSKCQQEYDELEESLRNTGVLAQTQKTEHLEMKARELDYSKKELERDLEQLKVQLDQQKEHRIKQETRVAVLEESLKTHEEEIKNLQSQEEQGQTTLKVYRMNSDRLDRNLETAGEENKLLQESNAQLRQQVEGWSERVSEVEEEMQRCQVTYSGMQQDVAKKDQRIMSLTDCLLRMKALDSDLAEEGSEKGAAKETSNGAAGKEEEHGRVNATDTQSHFQKAQTLIYAAKLNADLKSVDEDKDRVFAKLNDEIKAKEDLQVSIKELEDEKLSLQSDAGHYSDQVQRLQQKLHIMTEMYHENELKLHRLLTVEEKERLQKEEKLNKADKNIALAMEELNNYRQRAGEMEEELDKTKQSYQTQISAHEKKAHNNWLAAREAERKLSDIRRENALLRQKLTDTQFKLDTLDKDPYALESLARPMPFRGERSPYGPSPLGRPASETRAFLSPPTLLDGPPARLSPRVSRAPIEPPGGQGELECSGGPHSDSGSNSPSWERDRRGPPPGPPGPIGPPGYMFPEPGGPVYRRPPPPPGALGLLPPPGSLPPGPPPPHLRGFHAAGPLPGPPHPADMGDGPYRENSLGPGEQEHREQSGPGERRTPPEADLRMGPPLPPGPPLGPMDGPFPCRAPYGPPPPDFYSPRGPGVPPMMPPRWAPPPPGMMLPPRFPSGGFPPAPHPHYAPPMRSLPPNSLPPPSMALPPQQSLPSPPHSQLPEEHRPSPEDAI